MDQKNLWLESNPHWFWAIGGKHWKSWLIGWKSRHHKGFIPWNTPRTSNMHRCDMCKKKILVEINKIAFTHRCDINVRCVKQIYISTRITLANQQTLWFGFTNTSTNLEGPITEKCLVLVRHVLISKSSFQGPFPGWKCPLHDQPHQPEQ